jgi:hypothetical protein
MLLSQNLSAIKQNHEDILPTVRHVPQYMKIPTLIDGYGLRAARQQKNGGSLLQISKMHPRQWVQEPFKD